jgi:hypothetical protein
MGLIPFFFVSDIDPINSPNLTLLQLVLVNTRNGLDQCREGTAQIFGYLSCLLDKTNKNQLAQLKSRVLVVAQWSCAITPR